MFSGITRGTFPVAFVRKTGSVQTFGVRLPSELTEGLVPGASVSVDGVCQTVVKVQPDPPSSETSVVVTFDAIQETLKVTTLGTLTPGVSVAIERSLRVGDEIGGHRVSGHVTGMAIVDEVVSAANGVHDLWLSVPHDWLEFILPKGFIAVDGSSLTVGQVDEAACRFRLHLIPETVRITNLGGKRSGDRVNIELDAETVTIVRTVSRERRHASTHAALVPDSPYAQ